VDTVTLQLDGLNPEATGQLLAVALGTIVAPSAWHAVGRALPEPMQRVAVYTQAGALLSAYHTGARWIFHSRRQNYTVTHWRPWEN